MNAEAVSPCSSPVLDYLHQLHREFSGVTEGQVATYIPELAKANPNTFGICLVTTGGVVYEAGDSQLPFTIQSISKPFVYGLALEDHGRPHVLTKVGMEPTGEAFNSISLEPGTGRPRNPMINAGAIAVAGLIAGKSRQTKKRRILEMLGRYAGRELTLDDAVYRSESETGHRNRAIGHMLRNFGILADDPIPSVELYFEQCSISVTCRDLGIMAATLANRGTNPITGKQALRGEYTESVLSVMGSCGMYDYAGEWLYQVGMPAKSGVSGGIIAVLPGQLGIGVYSPPLDSRGNSVRGIRVADALSRHCDLHLYNLPSHGRSAIRLRFNAAEFSSSRLRTPAESHALHEHGTVIKVYQLQGHLTFSSTESVVREVIDQAGAIEYLILDCKSVLTLNESASRLLCLLVSKFLAVNKPILFTHAAHLPLLRQLMRIRLGDRFKEAFRVFPDNDPALEWCENRLLEVNLPQRPPDRTASPEEYDLLADLTSAEMAIVVPLLRRRHYQPAEVIIQAGEEALEIFFLARGRVSVLVMLASGIQRRLATFSAGMVFGEMAVLDGAPRSATIVADSEVECDLLTRADFERLSDSYPAVRIKLLENLSLILCRRLRKANRELSVFES